MNQLSDNYHYITLGYVDWTISIILIHIIAACAIMKKSYIM